MICKNFEKMYSHHQDMYRSNTETISRPTLIISSNIYGLLFINIRIIMYGMCNINNFYVTHARAHAHTRYSKIRIVSVGLLIISLLSIYRT